MSAHAGYVEAIEAAERAILTAVESDLDEEDAELFARVVLDAALPVLLAAGWLPPDALVEIGWMDANGTLFEDDGGSRDDVPVFVKRGVSE